MLSWLAVSVAWSFCGTYVGPADETPINNESRLVVVQNPDGTVLTMTSDATEAPDSFGLLMPVPSDVTEDDIEVVSDISALEELDNFTAPRVVSYTCESAGGDFGAQVAEGCAQSGEGCLEEAAMELANGALPEIVKGVDVLSLSTKGIYQVAILRADDAGALQNWLDVFGFQTAPGTDALIDNYIDQGVNFMAGRITRFDGPQKDPWLQPIRIRYDERTFSLPLRLGANNANGDQDVLLWVVGSSSEGEAQVTSFPEVQQESDCMIPPDSDSTATIRKAFREARGQDDGVAVVEYSWDLSTSCDPCTADNDSPTSFLTELGSTQVDAHSGAIDAYVTRLRMRFDPFKLDTDLHFSFTNSRDQRQLVYIEHRDELEATFPICFEGFPDNPAGTCDEEVTGETAKLPWWSLGLVPLFGWGLRRRRDERA